MKTKKFTLAFFLSLLISCGVLSSLSARQGARDSTGTNNQNNSNGGIPGTGNTLYPNNGPEFPHSSPSNASTDPGPLFHGPSGQMFDSIPDPQKGSHVQPQ